MSMLKLGEEVMDCGSFCRKWLPPFCALNQNCRWQVSLFCHSWYKSACRNLLFIINETANPGRQHEEICIISADGKTSWGNAAFCLTYGQPGIIHILWIKVRAHPVDRHKRTTLIAAFVAHRRMLTSAVIAAVNYQSARLWWKINDLRLMNHTQVSDGLGLLVQGWG